MGNNQKIYEDKYIRPNKIEKTNIQEKKIDMQKIFGKVNISSARAQLATQSINHLSQSMITYIHKIYGQQNIQQHFQYHNDRIKEDQQNIKNLQIQHAQSRLKPLNGNLSLKAFSQKIRRLSQQQDIGKYGTCKVSPVKEQNKKPQQSRIKIFKSRHQSQYFRLKQ